MPRNFFSLNTRAVALSLTVTLIIAASRADSKTVRAWSESCWWEHFRTGLPNIVFGLSSPAIKAAPRGKRGILKGVPLMRYREWFLAGVLVVGVLAATTSSAHARSFRTLDVPGAELTVAHGINASGAIVGFYSRDGFFHGFVLDNGTFSTIDVPGASVTVAYGINARRQIVGYYIDFRSFVHGFVLKNGTFTTIDFPGTSFTVAYGINDLGQIAGYYSRGGSLHGFVLKKGAFTTIDVAGVAYGINNFGKIVGFDFFDSEAFVLESGVSETINVPSAILTHAYGINGVGQIVGDYNSGGLSHGFVLDEGIFTTMDVPGSSFTVAYAINTLRQIVGFYVAGGITHGFIWY